MSTFVLVHGALNDGSVWGRVAAILRRNGHQVFSPTLTPPQNIGLADNIKEVVALIKQEDLKEVVLAGHSYAALVITGVFERLSERIARLVYIDSAIPVPGQSLYGLIAAYGGNTEKQGLPDFRPFTDKLLFNELRWQKVPKIYVHCLRSEFLTIGNKAAALVKMHERAAHWTYYELDTSHHCMTEQPEETAYILMQAAA